MSFSGGPSHLAAEMGARARKAWGKNKGLLLAKTELKQRLQLHNVLVRQSALWGCETWPVQDTLLRAVNNTAAAARQSHDRGEQSSGGGLDGLEHTHPAHGQGTPAQEQDRAVVHVRAQDGLGDLGARGQSQRHHLRHAHVEGAFLVVATASTARRGRSTARNTL